jgi:hypothetical protein
MRNRYKKFLHAGLMSIVFAGSLLPSFGTMKPIHTLAASVNQDDPPNAINLTNIFTTPTGSNSSVINNNIVQVTPGSTNQKGGIWSTEANKMDLTTNFHASMYLYFGNQGANAADGMAFVMHNDARGTNALSPHSGSGLGVYAGQNHGSSKTDGIQKSFAVEFDTYINNNGNDGYFDTNTSKGHHVAWSYPGKASTYIDYQPGMFDYRRTMKHNDIDGTTNGVQYPGNLSNDSWRKFTVDWNAATSTLTYQLAGLTPVTIPLNVQDVFGSNLIFWGFTGSTGSKYQMNRVAFVEVPGLVNAEVKETVAREDGTTIDDLGAASAGEELTYTIHAKYLSGKQDWTDIIVKTTINDYVSYVPGSMKLALADGSGGVLSDHFWSGQSLALPILDLRASMNEATISFKVKVNSIPGDQTVTENVKFEGSNYITNTTPIQYIIKHNQKPEVTIDETGPIHLLVGEDYQVGGTWKDIDDPTNTLYYSLNGNLLKSEVLDNGGSIDPVGWSYLLTSEQFQLGENHFQVVARDLEGAYSISDLLKIIVESPPSISLNYANSTVPLDFENDFTLSGSWNDLDSNTVDLYYQINGEAPVNFAVDISNSANKGENVSYSYTIPASEFSIGLQQVSVYTIDDSNRKSNVEHLTVDVTGQVVFTTVSPDVSFRAMQIPNQPTLATRNHDWNIHVKDTRGAGSLWRVTATLAADFADIEGHLLTDALKFVDGNGTETNMPLGTAVNVFTHTTDSTQEVPLKWNVDQGILLKVNPSVYAGDYAGTIDWTLVDAP